MEKIKFKFKSKICYKHRSSINKGERIVLVDDVLATGGTLNAAIQLIEQSGAEVVQVLLLNRVQSLNGIKKLSIA